jgi:hypothetical protein
MGLVRLGSPEAVHRAPAVMGHSDGPTARKHLAVRVSAARYARDQPTEALVRMVHCDRGPHRQR